MVTGAWQGLQEKVAAEFAKSGIERDRIEFTHSVRMQYYGQLNDIEIVSPHMALQEASQVDDLIATFEDAYGKVFARSARSPELGYLITHAIVHGSVPVEKPVLPDQARSRARLRSKASREVHWGRRASCRRRSTSSTRCARATRSTGPAIVESVATTLALPPGGRARLDRHQIFHLPDGRRS